MPQDYIQQVDFNISVDKLALDCCENFNCFFDFVNGTLRQLAGCIFICIYNREREREGRKKKRVKGTEGESLHTKRFGLRKEVKQCPIFFS